MSGWIKNTLAFGGSKTDILNIQYYCSLKGFAMTTV